LEPELPRPRTIEAVAAGARQETRMGTLRARVRTPSPENYRSGVPRRQARNADGDSAGSSPNSLARELSQRCPPAPGKKRGWGQCGLESEFPRPRTIAAVSPGARLERVLSSANPWPAWHTH